MESNVIDVTAESFVHDVIEESKQRPVLVDFWAKWCGPCLRFGPVLEAIAKRHQGAFRLAKVEIDQHPILAERYGVQSVPMVLVFKDGGVVDGFFGALPEREVESFLTRFIPRETDAWMREAEQKLEASPQEAADLYRQVLEADPERSDARLGLGRALERAGDLAGARQALEQAERGPTSEKEARALLLLLDLRERVEGAGGLAAIEKRLESSPEDLELRYLRAAALAAAKRFEDAFETLLSIIEMDRGWRDGLAKDTMVKLFLVVGARSELADRFRGRLAQALY